MPLLEIVPSEKLLKTSARPIERQKLQEFCARLIELGHEESGYDLQQKELGKALRTWFI